MKYIRVATVTVCLASIYLTSCGNNSQPAPEIEKPSASELGQASPEKENASMSENYEVEKTKSIKHNFETISVEELKNSTRDKNMEQVIEFLGPPTFKKRHLPEYLIDVWVCEWNIRVDDKKKDVIYPKVGIMFPSSTKPMSQWFLNEHLPGNKPPY